MEFFTGFRWAVPMAFRDAVSLCWFVEGDMLYDNQIAYRNKWEEARKQIVYSIQVRYPTRAAGPAAEGGRGTFGNNWNSEIRIDLYKHLEKICDQRVSTQGRLYTTLWKGGVELLNAEGQTPEIPINLQQVTRSIGETKDVAMGLSGGRPVFVMARDLSSPVSREKYSRLVTKLRTHLADEPTLLSPESAGLKGWSTVAPTIEIAFFRTNGLSADRLHEMIKEAVYIPAKDARKEMFRISAHGMIV